MDISREAADPEQRPKAPPTPQLAATVIEGNDRWPFVDLAELWRYRELLVFLAWRDVSVRYKQTVLGIGWAVLQPVLLMLVFSRVLGGVAAGSTSQVPYPLFVYSGLLPWFLFATAVAGAADSLINSERLVTKVYFPRLVMPFGAAGVALLDFMLAFVVLGVLMAVYGNFPGTSVLLVPVALSFIFLTALGVGTLLAALNVKYRDFRYALPFLIQLWMFATSSIYLAPGVRSGKTAPLLDLVLSANPLTGLIAFFRASLLGTELPWRELCVGGLTSLVIFVVGCLCFRRMEDTFADVI